MTRQTELNLIDEMTGKLAQLKLAEQAINDLTATCRKQAGQIADLLELLVMVLEDAQDYGNTNPAKVSVSTINRIRAALEQEQVTP